MKKVKKLSLKALAVFLSFIIVALTLPLSVFAENLRDALADLQGEEAALEKEIFELKELRTAASKTFHLKDGKYVLTQYDTAVHEKDSNGVWQDIDNTLSTSGDTVSNPNARVKFAKKTNGNGALFTLHNGNQKLSLSLLGAEKKVMGQITNLTTELGEDATELQKLTTLNQISASIVYEDILDGVDLEYVINGLNIKENIIVKEKKDSYVYGFEMNLNNLTPTVTEAGEILLADTAENVVYRMSAPMMWDSVGAYSEQVELDLADQGNGKYLLTVTAASAWVNAPERVFPITVDPPIYTESNGCD